MPSRLERGLRVRVGKRKSTEKLAFHAMDHVLQIPRIE